MQLSLSRRHIESHLVPISALNGLRKSFHDRPSTKGFIPAERNKRSVIDFAIGAFISNVVSTVADKIWSSGNEAELKERNHLLEERLNRLVEEMNITELIKMAQAYHCEQQVK